MNIIKRAIIWTCGHCEALLQDGQEREHNCLSLPPVEQRPTWYIRDGMGYVIAEFEGAFARYAVRNHYNWYRKFGAYGPYRVGSIGGS